jgi:hypothetical protein
VEQRVLALRWEHHECCGEKIVYWLAKEDIYLSRSTVYRILNKHLQLRPKKRRGNIASGPREVIQMDTIDLGEVFALTAIDIYTREGQVVLQPGLSFPMARPPLSSSWLTSVIARPSRPTAALNSRPNSLNSSRLPLTSIASLALTRKTSKPSLNALI